MAAKSNFEMGGGYVGTRVEAQVENGTWQRGKLVEDNGVRCEVRLESTGETQTFRKHRVRDWYTKSPLGTNRMYGHKDAQQDKWYAQSRKLEAQEAQASYDPNQSDASRVAEMDAAEEQAEARCGMRVLLLMFLWVCCVVAAVVCYYWPAVKGWCKPNEFGGNYRVKTPQLCMCERRMKQRVREIYTRSERQAIRAANNYTRWEFFVSVAEEKGYTGWDVIDDDNCDAWRGSYIFFFTLALLPMAWSFFRVPFLICCGNAMPKRWPCCPGEEESSARESQL